jgi:hypothetical protein
MRLNALCLISALTVVGVPLSAWAVPAQAGHHAAASAQQARSTTRACPPGYDWEPAGYIAKGKYRPARCARRW